MTEIGDQVEEHLIGEGLLEAEEDIDPSVLNLEVEVEDLAGEVEVLAEEDKEILKNREYLCFL